jgi:AcrR family transcriptional regulator
VAQVLKDDVRRRIVDAALDAFAAAGWRGARLADIAAAAGVSTGNVYRYFPDKEALLRAAVPPELAARLLRLLRRRVRALGTLADWGRANVGEASADELLALWIAHRREVVVLLGRAEGSPLGHVHGLVVGELTRLAARWQRAHGGRPATPETRFVLRRIFEGTVGMIVDVLAEHDDARAIREAFRAFWRFQLAGLQALLEPERR